MLKTSHLICFGQTSMAVKPSARQCLEIASDKSSHSSDSTAELLVVKEYRKTNSA